MLHYAIDWCLTPTLVVIQLYRVQYAYLVEPGVLGENHRIAASH
jgi:hypothetical protein